MNSSSRVVQPESRHSESAVVNAADSRRSPSELRAAFITLAGDPSVGIHSVTMTLSDIGWYADAEDRQNFRKALADFFGSYFDDRCSVMFDDETEQP